MSVYGTDVLHCIHEVFLGGVVSVGWGVLPHLFPLSSPFYSKDCSEESDPDLPGSGAAIAALNIH